MTYHNVFAARAGTSATGSDFVRSLIARRG